MGSRAGDLGITSPALSTPAPRAAPEGGGGSGRTDVPGSPAVDAALGADGAGIAVNLTPAGSHARYTRSALEHGLHVFTEKPLALGLDEARALMQLAQSRGLTLAVMSNPGQDARFLAFAGLVRSHGPGP